MRDRLQPSSVVRWFAVKNLEEELIPPFAVMEVSSVDTDEQATILVRKPTASGITNVLINSATEISAESYGQAHHAFPCMVLFDPSDGDPEVGQSWGVKEDSWRLSINQPGFLILGGVFTSRDVEGSLTGSDGSIHLVTVSEAKKTPRELVRITSTTRVADPITGVLRYPAEVVYYEPVTGEITAGEVCWWVDPNE